MRRELGLAGTMGLVVINLEAGGPADRAGLLLGDIITGLEGNEVSDPSDILTFLGPERVGQQASLQLVRAGQTRPATITVGERPRKER
jgi:S1-C subfamily serine protease